MKKRILSLFVIMCMLLPCIPVIVFAQTGTVSATGAFDAATGLTWTVYDGTKLVISKTANGTGAMPNYTGADDKPWKTYRTAITSAVFEDGVVYIGERTFQECTSLTTVTMADSVTSMGTYVFNACSALTSVKLSENLANLPNGTFNNAKKIMALEIPYKTTITNVSDNNSALRGVSTDLVLTVYEGSAAHTWAKSSGTDGKTPLIKKLNKTLAYVVKTVEKPSGSGNVIDDGSITWAVEDGVLTISGAGAMPNYSATSDQPWNALRANITKVVIGDGITYIGNRAFQEDTNLTTVTMADSVTSMGTFVFNACSKLASVKLSANLAALGRAAFYNASLKEITIPSKTTVADDSFNKADENIVINVYAGSVAHTAFGADLTITDENSVARVCTLINTESGTDGTTTWSWDYNTKTVTIGGTGAMTSWQTTDAAATDYFNRRGWDGYKASVNNVVIGNGITAVGEYAFFQCSNVSDIELPASLKRLYRYSFADMILDEVSIPAGVETIDANAFRGLSSNPTITKLVVNGNDTILRVLISNGVEQTALNRQTNAVVYCNYASTVAATAKAQGIPYRYMDVDYVIESYDSETMTANIINSTTAAKNATVIFVAYKDKAISDVSTVSSELEVGATPVVAGSDFDQTDADKVSVFVWDGLNTMEPVGRTFAKAKVWMLGDSIMAYWGDGRYPQTGWGESFKKVVTSDLVVENRAVSGATAQRYYNYGWKGNDYFTEKNPVYNEVKEGDFVILSFLHNDYSQTVNTTSDNYKSTEYINTYKRYIEMFAEDCAAKGAKLILVVPPNAGGTATNYHAQPVDGVNVGDFSAVIPAVAKELGIPCVNIHKWTLDNLAADASFADRIYLNRNYLNGLVASGAMTKTEQEEHTNSRVAAGNDTTHPSIIGCKSIAEFVAAQLKTMNTGLEKFLK